MRCRLVSLLRSGIHDTCAPKDSPWPCTLEAHFGQATRNTMLTHATQLELERLASDFHRSTRARILPLCLRWNGFAMPVSIAGGSPHGLLENLRKAHAIACGTAHDAPVSRVAIDIAKTFRVTANRCGIMQPGQTPSALPHARYRQTRNIDEPSPSR